MDGLTLEYIIPKYNDLLESHHYEINARIRLVEYLHSTGVKYRDIYAIIDKEPKEAAY